MEFNLKAVEIYEKEFTRSKKDKEFYSIEEVNEYLDLIIEDYQKIEKLTERLVQLEEENSKLKAEVANLKGEEVVQPKDEMINNSSFVSGAAVGAYNLANEAEEIDTDFQQVETSSTLETSIERPVEETVNTEKIDIVEDKQETIETVGEPLEDQVREVEDITSENIVEESNDEKLEEVVDTLTIDDIAEIRRLLQEEREALYKRNEA